MKAALTVLLLLCKVASAAMSVTETWNVSAVIPDNSATGWSDSRTLATSIDSISRVQVHLEITGGWNGDLYAYLQHGSGFSVLLNRPGRNTSNTDGSFASGMDVTFSDTATQSTHVAGIFSGDFLPDGRNVSPFTLTDQLAPGTAMLSSFNGLNTDGIWTLFVADLSPIATSTVVSWGLTIEMAAVPEPGLACATGLLLAGATLRRRRQPKNLRINASNPLSATLTTRQVATGK
jgi:subtilisin-like proprotein convertase family protein